MKDDQRKFSCPRCAALQVVVAARCADCGVEMHVAKLTCTVSPGPGASVGTEWLLLPHDYDLGRQDGNDLVMGDQFVSRHHLKLLYMNGGFYVKNQSSNRTEGDPEFCRLEHEDFLSLGSGRLKLEYLFPEARLSLDLMRQVLDGIYEMQYAETITEACRDVLGGFLSLTELEKGYAFGLRRVGKEILLTELASMATGGGILPPQDYRISQTLLSKVLDSRGEPLLYSDDHSDLPASTSIVKFHLKSVVCVPLLDREDRIVGVIYGDSRQLTTTHLIQFKPCMMLLARLLMRRLGELGFPAKAASKPKG